MPKGVRRNPFQALLDTAEKHLQYARERLATAERDADCIHQKKIRAARTEHDEWTKMVKQLRTSFTIPQLRPAPEPTIYDPRERVGKDGEVPGIPATKKQSNNDAGPRPAAVPLTEAQAIAMRDNPLSTHYQPNVGDVGDRMARRGPMTTKPRGRPGKVDHFDKCPGLPNLRCTNSKPFDSELCGRCATMRSIPPILRPRAS